MRGHIGSIGLRESRLTCMLHAVIRKIVGTRAETLVDEQNHNCSPILSIAFVFSMLSDVLMSLGLVS